MEFTNELRYDGRFSIRGKTEQIASFRRYEYNDIYSFGNLSSRARENLRPGIHIYANQRVAEWLRQICRAYSFVASATISSLYARSAR